MYIDCLWVAGQYKGQGNGRLLLSECIEDGKRKGKKGLVVLSSKKKQPFLSDSKFLKYHGFLTADTAAPFYELLYLPFAEGAEKPRFRTRLCAFLYKPMPLYGKICAAHRGFGSAERNTAEGGPLQRRGGSAKFTRSVYVVQPVFRRQICHARDLVGKEI